MAVLTDSIPVSTPSPEWDGATSWRDYLVEQFTWTLNQRRAELLSDHPYARHRIKDLEQLGSNILADLEELDARELATAALS